MSKSSMDEVFADIDKMNGDAAILSEHSLSLVDEWIDTGSMALNAICSGSLYKGLPNGRVVGFGGISGCGKTYILNQTIGNFQRKSDDRWAAVWDSEMAEDAQSAASVGADPTRIKHYPIDNVMHMRNQICTFLDKIIETNNQGKFIIGIDSLGNLAGEKETQDVEKDKQASDMGTRAKEIKAFFRAVTYRAAKSKTTIIFTNHIYSDPTAMFESVIKDQSGGKGPQYIASLLVQLGALPEEYDEKDSQDKIVVGARKYSSVRLRAITAKNRFIPQFLETDLSLNFKTGLDKYAGLFELAKGFGIVVGDKTWSIDGKKLGYFRDWRYDDGVWALILPKLEAKINEEWQFSKSNYQDLKNEVDKIKQ